MEPDFQSQQQTAETVPTGADQLSPSASTFKVNYLFHVAGGLLIAVGAVYGFLVWGTPLEAESQPAAALVSIEKTSATLEGLTLEAHSAFVVDLSRNDIVHAKNADVQLPLASITKVALVLTVAPFLSLDETVTISNAAVARGEGGLVAGDRWRIGDLLDYTLVASSNAGAEALAEAAEDRIRKQYPQAPETDATVWRMNMFAQELGLSKTYFLNASGLDVSPTQPGAMSSARDATILLAYAYKTAPQLFTVTRSTTLETGPFNGPKILAENTNDAIGSIPGLKMGKTGFTDLAGGNLGVVFEVDGRTMAATVMGSSIQGRFNDVLAITETARSALAK